jgi:hypothetical protein
MQRFKCGNLRDSITCTIATCVKRDRYSLYQHVKDHWKSDACYVIGQSGRNVTECKTWSLILKEGINCRRLKVELNEMFRSEKVKNKRAV